MSLTYVGVLLDTESVRSSSISCGMGVGVYTTVKCI